MKHHKIITIEFLSQGRIRVNFSYRCDSFIPCTILFRVLNIISENGSSAGTQGVKVFTIQKKAIRCLADAKYNAHTNPLFKELKLLKVQDIHKLQQIKLYYKFINNTVPTFIQNLPFYQNNETHTHLTRNSNMLHAPKASHEFSKQCLRYSLPILINSLEPCIKDKIHTHSLSGLSHYTKQFIIMNYESSCNIQNCYICQNQNNPII